MNYEGTKFSKSRNIGVFGDSAMESGISSNLWRFYLMYIRPESQDSSFTWDDFMVKINSELLNNIGNFINRAFMFVARYFDGKIPAIQPLSPYEKVFLAEVNIQLGTYINLMESCQMREALRTILMISHIGNSYLQASKPWVLVKNEQTCPRAGVIVSVASNVACGLSILLYPFMPSVAREIWAQANAPPNAFSLTSFFPVLSETFNADSLSTISLAKMSHSSRIPCFLPAGHSIGNVYPLFRKLEPDFIAQLAKRFSGKETRSGDNVPRAPVASSVSTNRATVDADIASNEKR